MNRRDTVLALAALSASPVLCNAQQPTMPVVGSLGIHVPNALIARADEVIE